MEVDMHNGTKYARDIYRATNTSSEIPKGGLELLKAEFYILEDYEVKMPKKEERMYWKPKEG